LTGYSAAIIVSTQKKGKPMTEFVEIITDVTDLERKRWRFVRLGHGIVLDEYRHERRKTKRHKFASHHYDGTVWTRLSQRNNRIPRPSLPDDVKAAAIQGFAALIKMADGE
jgi:hypothetical protein